MHKILYLCFWLGLAAWASAAETFALNDGSSVAGDIVKADDNGLFLRQANDSYTNVPWGRFSQDTLKQLAQKPKIRPLVDVFIEPTEADRPAKAELKLNSVTRLERPAQPALIGGLFKSPVGLFILLVLYLANLFAAYEISIVRGRPALQVIGLAAVLPVIGPIIFLALPVQADPALAEVSPESQGADAGAEQVVPEEIQIVEASWRQEEKKLEPQIFARGKFTFNKRFVETKFAGFVGVPKGDALKYTMTVKTPQGIYAVEHIAQIGQAEAIFETPQGQLTVPFADILEIKLHPKTA